MTRALIAQRKRKIIEQYGPWTAHNVHLGYGEYTIGEEVVGDEIRLQRIIQIASDITGQPLEELRVLDLGCLEGLFAIEFARRGARVVAIEGREANLAKARFAADVLGLDRLNLRQDDVRNLSKEAYGSFEVVLCLGIIYHLDIPDVFHFVESMAEACSGILIIEGHVSVTAKVGHVYKGKRYWGRRIVEYGLLSVPEDRTRQLWSSLDNRYSFWFTRPSLYNLLSDVGFTSVYECHNPKVDKYLDWICLVAVRGERQHLASAPLPDDLVEEGWPEKRETDLHVVQRWYHPIMLELSYLLARLLRQLVRFRAALTKDLPERLEECLKRLVLWWTGWR